MNKCRPIFTSIMILLLIGFCSNLFAAGTSTVTTSGKNMQSPLHTITDVSIPPETKLDEPKTALTNEERAALSKLSIPRQREIAKLPINEQKRLAAMIMVGNQSFIDQIHMPSSAVQLAGEINTSVIIGTPQQNITVQVLSVPPVYDPSLIIIVPPVANISCSLLP